MRKIAVFFISAIAALHLYIAWFEMFAWESRGPKVFASLPADIFAPTTAMAANQGLYNGFLAVGLIWSLFIKPRHWSSNVATCFLLFVAVAGIFGSLTVSSQIIFIQTVPALIALIFVHLSRKTI